MKNQWVTIGIALGLPLLLIVAVVLSLNISETRVNPQYDILYATGGFSYDPYYRVEGRRLTSDFVDERGEVIEGQLSESDYAYKNRVGSVHRTEFYRYDPIADSSSSVGGYAEARELDILSIDRSPDGYRVVESEGNSDTFLFPFFFDGDGSDGYVIEGNNGRKRIQLSGTNQYSTDIIGWVPK